MTRRKQTKTTERNIKTHKLEETHKNNRNTVYPALDPTANKYLSGSGWEISVFSVFGMCFFELCYVFLFLYVFLFDCKCNSLKHINKKTEKQKHNSKNSKTNRKTEIQDIQPTNRPRINRTTIIRGGSWAGYPVVLLFCLMFVLELFCCLFCFFLLLFV